MPYAMHIPRAGGPEVFERVDVPRPAPGPGQLLMRVAAVGVNFIETYQRAGIYAVDYPFVPGVEAAGVIEEIGDGVTEVPGGVRELTGGRGVDVVYDGVGKDTFEGSLSSLRIRGMLVLFGGASGQVPPFDLQRLNAHGSLTVTRPKIDDFLLDAEERRWRARELFDLVAHGDLKVDIGARFPLQQAGAAHAALESRATTGKVVLLP